MKLERLSILLIACLAFSTPAAAKITRYLSGNERDVRPALAGPALNLGGGGPDVDAAIQWMIDQVRGCRACRAKVDVVVLRASGADGYNAPIMAMNGVDSVESIVVTSREDAHKNALAETIKKAEVVFFAGGDQCRYVEYFKGTPVEEAVETVYARGGAVGGTSAGLAVQSPFVYDGCRESAVSSDALADPFHDSITFSYDFFGWKDLSNVLTDSHFTERDRMGRLLVFLARQIRDNRAATALGLGVGERTSVVVDRNGTARVIGDGFAYFVLADHAPEVCEPGRPLTFSDYKIWKIGPGETYDLRRRPATGFYRISVTEGRLSGNPY